MWKLPRFEAISQSKAADVDVVFVAQEPDQKTPQIKGQYAPTVTRLTKSGVVPGRFKSLHFIRFGGKAKAESVLFVGFGSPKDLSLEKARQMGGMVWSKMKASHVKTLRVYLDQVRDVAKAANVARADVSASDLAYAFAEGFVMAAYVVHNYKSKPKKKGEDYFGPTQLSFVTQDKGLRSELAEELSLLESVGEAVNHSRDWSNEPSNIGTPEHYAAFSKKIAPKYGLKCKVLTEKDLAREKMELYLAVSRGSTRPPRLVVLEYTPKGVKNPKTVALVGKGVTFDSGGISLKPGLRMEDMKHDMGGAATVFGAILLAARMKVKNRVVAYMAFTENMPAGNATQPGNVVRGRNGKTVEIANTDAEGRLILADVLDYAHECKPDVIVNAATLTGAVTIALGRHCCGLMGNNQEVIDQLRKIGYATGERMWQLPMYDEYLDEMKSEYADIRNIANVSTAGTILGGIFLKQFIRTGMKWAHMDIAAVAYDHGHVSYCPHRGASGMYVRSMAKFARDFRG